MHPRPTRSSVKTLMLMVLVLGTVVLAATVPANTARAWPAGSKMSAVYKLRFAGIKIGNFSISSHVTGGRYALRGEGRITLLTSLIFEMTGGVASSGSLSQSGATPAAFSFNFKTKKNAGGHLVMKFNDGAVSQVASQPPLRPHPTAIPVTEKHVTGVLDPLTALFFATETKGPGHPASVCDRRIPVYDGLYRFDLQLSHKKTVRVLRKGKSGYAGPAVICRVKYIPVAGHSPYASAIAYMAETDDIEVWLIPLPENHMYAPYHMSIPTPYGTAQATSTAFHVETANQKTIALVH
jgi:hypothetical protein